MWGFHPPKQDDTSRIAHTWNAIEAFLGGCEDARQSVVHLYENLMVPPLGAAERSTPDPLVCRNAPLQNRNRTL